MFNMEIVLFNHVIVLVLFLVVPGFYHNDLVLMLPCLPFFEFVGTAVCKPLTKIPRTRGVSVSR